MRINVAVYTAGHGLDWIYDRASIGYAELDACRTAFGVLPNFDADEKGFEGIRMDAERVFFVRCFRAPKWDFRGRDATYLAVVWLPRKLADGVSVEKMLALRALQVSMRAPCLTEDVPDADIAGDLGLSLEKGPYRREIGERIFRKVELKRINAFPQPSVQSETCVTTQPQVTGQKPMSWILWVAAVGLAVVIGWVVYDYFQSRKEVQDDASREVSSGTWAERGPDKSSEGDAGGTIPSGGVSNSVPDHASSATNVVRGVSDND